MTTLGAGDLVRIESYKHNGSVHRQWEENIVLHRTENILIGMNDQTKVIEPNKQEWVTTEPGLFYFHNEFWFNIIRIFNEEKPYFYCNLSSPFMYKVHVLSYIDYDLDLMVYDDFTYKLLDEDEYGENKDLLGYGKAVDQHIQKHMMILRHWIETRKGPFADGFINYWYRYYLKKYK